MLSANALTTVERVKKYLTALGELPEEEPPVEDIEDGTDGTAPTEPETEPIPTEPEPIPTEPETTEPETTEPDTDLEPTDTEPVETPTLSEPEEVVPEEVVPEEVVPEQPTEPEQVATMSLMAELFPEEIATEEEPLSPFDENLVFLINAASDIIEKFCRRRFGFQVYEEFLIGRDSVKLVLHNLPIIAVENLEIQTSMGREILNTDMVRIMGDEGMLYRINGIFPSHTMVGRFMHPNFDNPLHNILVRYSAGYVLPKDETEEYPRTLPYDLELACMKVVVNLLRDQKIAQGATTGDNLGNQTVKSESLGDWSISYDSTIKLDADYYVSSLSKDVQSVLCKYRVGDFYV